MSVAFPYNIGYKPIKQKIVTDFEEPTDSIPNVNRYKYRSKVCYYKTNNYVFRFTVEKTIFAAFAFLEPPQPEDSEGKKMCQQLLSSKKKTAKIRGIKKDQVKTYIYYGT